MLVCSAQLICTATCLALAVAAAQGRKGGQAVRAGGDQQRPLLRRHMPQRRPGRQ